MEADLWCVAAWFVAVALFVWAFSRHELGGKREQDADLTRGDWWEE